LVVTHKVRIVILMGVTGSGKTTIGQLLAKDCNWPFYEGDDFHPAANVEKMRRSIPLTDEDRAPWLAALDHLIRDLITQAQSAVIACSALKQSYRDRLAANRDEVVFVYLKGDYDLARERLRSRKGHFMKEDLLASQFDTVEEPEGVLTVDIAQEPDVIVGRIKQALGLSQT
jgi:gluconokinase